ncbi:MAG: hypothetical protein ABSA27_11930 [Terriglobales bacterium]
MSTQKKSLISQHSAVKKANLANATNTEKPSVSAPISGSVKPRLAKPEIGRAAISRVNIARVRF